MPPCVAFHLGLLCLPKYMSTGIHNEKGYSQDFDNRLLKLSIDPDKEIL